MIWYVGVGEVVAQVVVVVGVDTLLVEEISLLLSLAAYHGFSEQGFAKHGPVASPLHEWMGCSEESEDMHTQVLGRVGPMGHKLHCH